MPLCVGTVDASLQALSPICSATGRVLSAVGCSPRTDLLFAQTFQHNATQTHARNGWSSFVLGHIKSTRCSVADSVLS